MNNQKPKTHRTVHWKLKPGQSFPLQSGEIITNTGEYAIFIKVSRPIESNEGTQNAKPKTA